MEGNKSNISPTKLSSSFLKMLRLRRHSLPSTNSGKVVVVDKPQMHEEQRPNIRPARQRCVTETIAEIATDNSRTSKTLHGNFEIDSNAVSCIMNAIQSLTQWA